MTSAPAAPRCRRAARTPGGSPQRGPEGGKPAVCRAGAGPPGRPGAARRTACATARRRHARSAAGRRSDRCASPRRPSAPSGPSSPANTATYTNAPATPAPRAPRRSTRSDTGYASASTSLHERTGCQARYGQTRTLIRSLIYEEELSSRSEAAIVGSSNEQTDEDHPRRGRGRGGRARGGPVLRAPFRRLEGGAEPRGVRALYEAATVGKMRIAEVERSGRSRRTRTTTTATATTASSGSTSPIRARGCSSTSASTRRAFC